MRAECRLCTPAFVAAPRHLGNGWIASPANARRFVRRLRLIIPSIDTTPPTDVAASGDRTIARRWGQPDVLEFPITCSVISGCRQRVRPSAGSGDSLGAGRESIALGR